MSGQSAASTGQADPAPHAFFEATYRAFLSAAHASGAVPDRFFDIAGHVVRLRFAGPALIPRVTRALAHVAIPPTTMPALTVCVWDGASTGTRMPLLPWAGVILSRRGDVQGFSDHRIRTAFDRASDILSCLDTQDNLALFCTRAAETVPVYETAAPFTAILSGWLRTRNLALVHAGAVAWQGAGLLLAGRSGSGKSTTALACLNSSLGYVADDSCAVTTDSAPRIWNIYNTGKVTRDGADRLPHLGPALSNPDRLDQEKGVLFVNEHFPGQLTRSCSLRAIVLPRITTRVDPVLEPAPRAEAASALGLGSVLRFAGADEETLRDLVRVSRTVPCYHLQLGADLAKIPDLLRDVLGEW